MLDIRIASPCPADWEQMPGNDRVRHCRECNLNVYDLSALTEREIRALVANSQGRLCGRLYRRHDGTMITRDCPAGLKAIGRRISRIAGAILSLAIPSLTAATPTLAQSYSHTNLGSAGVSLQVMDPSGAFISEATVILDDLSRNHTIHGMADKNGRALLWAPLGGSYRLRVSAPSMQTFTREVALRSGQILSLPVKLDVGALTGLVVIESISRPDRESVPVSAPSPIIRSGPGAMQN